MSNYLLQRKVSDSQLETVILSIDNLPLISNVTENSTAPITSGAVFSALALKQNTLVSGTNIKTFGGVSVLGSGDIPAPTSAEFSSSNTQLNGLSINGTNYKILDVKVNDGSSLIIGGNRKLASGASKVVAIGDCKNPTASGDYSTALGYDSTAIGFYATAIGGYSTASNSFSTALGDISTASGDNSTAIGFISKASGYGSTAIGCYSSASGSESIAIGYYSNVYVPNWIGFDGKTDDYVRTLALKSTDNVFFRNENVDTSKTTQESYTSGKTLTQVLSGKQDTLTFDTTPTANSTNPVISGGIKTYVDSAVSSVYKYKGSVATYADLPTTDLTTGDVYNSEDTGDNYAWTGTAWDKLGGTVDLSAYLTTATAENTYAKLSSVNSALAGKQETLVSGTNIKTIGGVSVLGSGNIPMPTSGYKQTFNVNGSEWGNCYKGLNEMLKEDDMGKPADTYVGLTITRFKSWQLNGVDVAYPKQITGANSYSARLESGPIDIANLSWDNIIALAKNKAFDSTYLGQTKQLDIGGVAYTVQIVGVNHDDLTDGTGKANLTFELKYLLANDYAMNNTRTNSGGWEATAMRTNVLPNILSQMPTNIQNAIKSVNKANCKVYNSATITYTSDKLFLLSEAELFGVKSQAKALEGTQYEYWANNNTNTARIKYQGEGGTTVSEWWLRSPISSNSSVFCGVSASGNIGSYYPNQALGVSLAFDL